MKLTRRNAMTLTAAALAGSAACQTSTANAGPPNSLSTPATPQLPDRKNFSPDGIYLNAGSQHPFSKSALASLDAYNRHRLAHAPSDGYELNGNGPIEKFARLVNADPKEISYVQSTTAGEQAIVRSLGLPAKGAKIVTDTLHFFGSFPLYGELEKQGCDVSWVTPVDGRIRLEDMDKAITPGTKLVSLSLVSTVNGFEHDLKAICDLAHSRGALVYADIIHAAGCIPVDLHATGVDFAASATYKWLMGDFGLGFLYVKEGAQAHLERTNYGYYGVSKFSTHTYPFDAPESDLFEYEFSDDASGLFAIGTRGHTNIALLNASLDYILELGVDAIQAHAQTLTDSLKEGLASQGFELMTPPESKTPIVTAAFEGAYERLTPLMKARGIKTTISRNRFRPTVSVFNTTDDVEAFLEATASVS